MFSDTDIAQIRQHGISVDAVASQIKRFESGFPYADIIRPADPQRGILHYSGQEQEALAERFDARRGSLSISKFIPASGAATRMFRDLYAIRERLAGKPENEQLDLVTQDEQAGRFFSRITEFPFYRDLKETGAPEELRQPSALLNLLLSRDGLGYGDLPKGLLKFHNYPDGSRTAFGEHLVESPAFCATGKEVRLHFTVSPEHEAGFRELQAKLIPALEHHLGVKYDIGYSFQQPSTDTIAVDMENRPFRDPSGRLVFRPGGHGALLGNLDAIDSDLIFISNIDNVAPERIQPERIRSKKFLGGVLLELREQVFDFLERLRGTGSPGRELLEEVRVWMKEKGFIDVPDDFTGWPEGKQKSWLLSKLDRPIRVCGMVRNEGEPGGGPFFMRSSSGEISLQIVELSQIDTDDPVKKAIVDESTHFNPVDLVCSVKKPGGEKYRLPDFRDPETGFISIKSMGGRDLKALELPGLWNGSMSDWITVFVEVSSITFSPVKTVFDLLRPEHRV